MSEKPDAPSVARNRDPIRDVLRMRFADRRRVLEIGSGTGQHAVHFAAAMPWLSWQCSDRAEHLPGMRLWLDEAALPNTPAPIELDAARGPWPQAAADGAPFDAVFSANTLHIMGWDEVVACFGHLAALRRRALEVAPGHGLLLTVYGPFNYGGDFTSDSNRQFDEWLRARGAHMGVRDFEAVDALARDAGLALVDDLAMPANNRCITWRG